MYRQGLIFCLAATLLFNAGCATTKAPDEAAITPPPTQSEAPPAVTDQRGTDKVAAPEVVAEPVVEPVVLTPVEPLPVLQSVPFEYDQHLLTDAAREILSANVAILKAQSQLRVTLAGYCDERGADQYNIALGERRAESVRNYLLSRGISEGRLEAVSYGEEKPLDPGHDEEAWAKNRRVEFVPQS